MLLDSLGDRERRVQALRQVERLAVDEAADLLIELVELAVPFVQSEGIREQLGVYLARQVAPGKAFPGRLREVRRAVALEAVDEFREPGIGRRVVTQGADLPQPGLHVVPHRAEFIEILFDLEHETLDADAGRRAAGAFLPGAVHKEGGDDTEQHNHRLERQIPEIPASNHLEPASVADSLLGGIVPIRGLPRHIFLYSRVRLQYEFGDRPAFVIAVSAAGTGVTPAEQNLYDILN
ncbi:MAG: hypothetical protein OXT63_03815 [Gemmatimonadota bacterium]|nr:hypothetical protein [Gemmatimonadota bacterium]